MLDEILNPLAEQVIGAKRAFGPVLRHRLAPEQGLVFLVSLGGGQIDDVVEQVAVGRRRRQLEPCQRVGVLPLRLICQIGPDRIDQVALPVVTCHLAQRCKEKLECGQALLPIDHLHRGCEVEFRVAIDGG